MDDMPEAKGSRFKLFIPLLVFLLLAAFFFRGLSLDPTRMPSALIDQPMPAFSLTTVLDTQRLVTQDVFKGQVSLLNVWATWCISCRVEHAYLVKLAASGVPIYGVNYKDETSKAQQWLKDLNNPYVLSVVDSDGRLGIDLGVFGAPETYIIDKRGVIRYKHVGVLDERVWREKVEPVIKTLQSQES